MLDTFVFTNLNSGKNLRNRFRVFSLERALGNKGKLFKTKDLEELEGIVSNIHLYNPRSIILDGGDGGITGFFSLFLKYWPKEKELPRFGFMPGGTFNLLSKHCKVKKPKKYLDDIINAEGGELYSDISVDLMRVSDNNGLVSYGFSFGMGAPITLLDEYYKRKRMKHLRILFILARLRLSQGTFRQKYYELFNKKINLNIKAKVNGDEFDDQRDYLGLMAHTIETIGLPWSAPFYKAKSPGNFMPWGLVLT